MSCDSSSVNCSCHAFAMAEDVCVAMGGKDVSEVRVEENADLQAIKFFATQISTQTGFLPGSKAIFEQKYLHGHVVDVRLKEIVSDPDLRAPNTHFAYNHMMSPNGSDPFLYFAEFETDSVSVFALPGLEFVQRMTNGDRRFQFFGLPQNCSNPNDCDDQFVPGSDQKAFGPSSVCSWDTFEFDERLYALASRGCGWLNGLDDVDQLDLSCKTATGHSCAPSVDAFTVGLWDFTEANTYGNQAMKTNAFINNALVCGHDQCTPDSQWVR